MSEYDYTTEERYTTRHESTKCNLKGTLPPPSTQWFPGTLSYLGSRTKGWNKVITWAGRGNTLLFRGSCSRKRTASLIGSAGFQFDCLSGAVAKFSVSQVTQNATKNVESPRGPRASLPNGGEYEPPPPHFSPPKLENVSEWDLIREFVRPSQFEHLSQVDS